MFKLKSVSEQDYCDCAEGIIDPQKFHRRFYFFLWIFQVLDAPIPKWTYFTQACTTFFPVTALCLISLGFYHAVIIKDIPLITEMGTYCILMSYKILILSCTKLNVNDYHQFQRVMKADFLYACTKGEKNRKKFFYNQIQARKIINLVIFFITGLGTGMIIFGITCLLLYYATDHSEGRKRPLMFPFWMYDVDFGATPTYEIALIFSYLIIVAYVLNYIFMLVTQVMWVSEITTKADIVIWCIQDLMNGIRPTNNETKRDYFDSLLKDRLKEIVEHHNSMNMLIEHYARVYKKLLMFEQKISAPLICMSAYSTTVKMDVGEFNAVLLLICIGAISLLFIPCYIGTFLFDKVASICDTCWSIPFWDAGPVIRPYLVLIMQRTLRSLPLKASGFEDVSIQTFSNKVASAYTMFNMLRQINI